MSCSQGAASGQVGSFPAACSDLFPGVALRPYSLCGWGIALVHLRDLGLELWKLQGASDMFADSMQYSNRMRIPGGM